MFFFSRLSPRKRMKKASEILKYFASASAFVKRFRKLNDCLTEEVTFCNAINYAKSKNYKNKEGNPINIQ